MTWSFDVFFDLICAWINGEVYDDVIKWKHFPCNWPFVRGIHRSPVNSLHKGQWHRALIFTLFCALNKRLSKQSIGWWFGTPSRSLWRHCNVNNQDAGDLRRHRVHYDATVMFSVISLNGIHCNSGHRYITVQLSVCYDLLAVSNIRGIHQARDPDIIWLLHVAVVPGIGCNLSPWDHRNLYCNCDSKK